MKIYRWIGKDIGPSTILFIVLFPNLGLDINKRGRYRAYEMHDRIERDLDESTAWEVIYDG